MASIEDRKRALENKYIHDQELKFLAEGRRNRLVAVWAAPIVGKSDVDAYIKEVVDAFFAKGGDAVYLKIRDDLDAADNPISDAELRAKLNEFLAAAEAELANG